MDDSDKALEHLRVIRELMEKATVYQAVSFPTALVSGLLALATSVATFVLGARLSPSVVMAVWLGIFTLVNAFHHGLIWNTARREQSPYLSSGLRMALKAILPALFVGGMLGCALGFGPRQDIIAATLVWVTFYGLALMATSGFSPRSLRVLGLVFTLKGSILLALYWFLPKGESLVPQLAAAIIMGMTFGVYHLVYAVYVRASQQQSETKD